jgi:hypothetical protein
MVRIMDKICPIHKIKLIKRKKGQYGFICKNEDYIVYPESLDPYLKHRSFYTFDKFRLRIDVEKNDKIYISLMTGDNESTWSENSYNIHSEIKHLIQSKNLSFFPKFDTTEDLKKFIDNLLILG